MVKTFQAPNDYTLGQGVFNLTPSTYNTFGGSPVPAWATGSTNWGLASYAANWMVFGDMGMPLTSSISDGLSKTMIVSEHYAICSRPTGTPRSGAMLWGYGWQVPTMSHQWVRDAAQLAAPSTVLNSQYNSPYWARSLFVNNPNTVPTEWTEPSPGNSAATSDPSSVLRWTTPTLTRNRLSIRTRSTSFWVMVV